MTTEQKPTKKSLSGQMKRLTSSTALREVIGFVSARMRETHVPEVASSMTLTTLLSIVPLLAVSLAVFSAFPSFADTRQALENMLFESFLPAQYSEVIVGYLRNFSTHASGLGLFGLIGLAITSLMLINKLFGTINSIFGVTKMRGWIHRLLLYWALLTLGPLVVAFSITVATTVLSAAARGLEATFMTEVLVLSQSALQIVAYAFLFRFIPNAFVRWSHAFVGGAFVVVANVLVRSGFEHYISAGTMGNIYGAFVALPVLLLWVYIGWYLIFLGAAVTATMPLLTSGRFRDTYRNGNKFLTGVALLKVLYEERAAERPVVPLALLCERVGTYPQLAREILNTLVQANYTLESASGPSDKNPDWTLVANPETTNLEGALKALLLDGRNQLVVGNRHEEGMLAGWYASLIGATSLSEPLSVTFEKGKEVASEG